MIRREFILDLHEELIVDNFAGGGGASTGIELALGRHVDIAVNHDPMALALHQANHPQTHHECEDVFKVDPIKITKGRPVGLAWFSPDCKDFSKAKGGKPRSKKIRGLAWVAVKWAATVRPRVIVLENVEEFQDWGPLLKDGTRCPKRKGNTFKGFVKRLNNLGYKVEWRELRACDYGAPTIRKRLFLVARRDGQPIVWPAPTHGNPKSPKFRGSKLKPWRTAAECIDWSIPCHSIFLTKEEARQFGVKRPLATATGRRLARGIRKFVIDAAEPFIVSLTHHGGDRVESIRDPFKTITGAQRGEKALAVPYAVEYHSAKRPGDDRVADISKPLPTQTTENRFALAQAFLAKHYGGVVGSDLKNPIGTVTSVDHHSLVAAHMEALYSSKGTEARAASLDEPCKTITATPRHALAVSHLSKLYGTTTGQTVKEPLHTITGGGNHIAEVRAFLQKYYSEGGQYQDLSDPLHTVPTKDRFGLVIIGVTLYQIVDICMRMLAPRELYNGQGFPTSYIIDVEVEVKRHGKNVKRWLTKTDQVRMCGNSVCPPLAEAIVSANVPELSVWRRGERKIHQRQKAA